MSISDNKNYIIHRDNRTPRPLRANRDPCIKKLQDIEKPKGKK